MDDEPVGAELEGLLARVRRAFEASSLSYHALAEMCGGRPSASTIFRTLKGLTAPRADNLFRIARALGAATTIPTAGSRATVAEIPVVAIGHASDGDREMLFEPVAVEEAETISFEGLVAVRVEGDSLLPIAARGQWILCDPNLHPDSAPPHRDFDAPIALVRLRDGRQLIKRWHHDRRRRVVPGAETTRQLEFLLPCRLEVRPARLYYAIPPHDEGAIQARKLFDCLLE